MCGHTFFKKCLYPHLLVKGETPVESPSNPPRVEGKGESFAMPSGSEKRKLSEAITVRVSAEEIEVIRRMADAKRLSVSGFLRHLLFPDWQIPKQSKKPEPHYALYSETMIQLGRLGSNVNQIARQLNRGRSPESEQIEWVQKEFSQLKSALMHALNLEEIDV
jgi:hypothetical protein